MPLDPVAARYVDPRLPAGLEWSIASLDSRMVVDTFGCAEARTALPRRRFGFLTLGSEAGAAVEPVHGRGTPLGGCKENRVCSGLYRSLRA